MVGPLNGSSPDLAPSVWLCRTDAGTADHEPPSWLTAEEHERLARLSGVARSEFLTSRWLIRRALSEASGRDARACCPAPGRTVASQSPPGWRLSLSHSQGLVGCALSPTSAIGLDLEPLTRAPKWRAIVRRWFNEAEQRWLLERNDHQAFLKVWTLKEAWLKATGRGIANNLKTLTVDEDFTLTGDRPEVPWRVVLGQIDGFLVTLVYQQPANENRSEPDCGQVSGALDWQNPSSGRLELFSNIDWLLRQPIH